MFLIKRQKSSVGKFWGLCWINVCDLWINPTAQEEHRIQTERGALLQSVPVKHEICVQQLTCMKCRRDHKTLFTFCRVFEGAAI